jgi:hypothetical protein
MSARIGPLRPPIGGANRALPGGSAAAEWVNEAAGVGIQP